jgi:alkaline phosphatase
MKRRDFFRNGTIAGLTAAFVSPLQSLGNGDVLYSKKKAKKAKNIIFLVSDGMSIGTLNMADMFLRRKEGRSSAWVELYKSGKAVRALMDTASASSLVTDSAAGSSAWGGGVRVPNGSLNIGANGEQYRPILQKFKAAGKAVGCVTMFAEYTAKGYQVAQSRSEMLSADGSKPLMAVFYKDGLPFTVDRNHEKSLQEKVPSLAEMTSKAIDLMKKNPKGFVMQVEGGKVDWAAHSNDIGGLIYDQIAFDEAIKVALDFAEKDGETLVLITTDHGNSNPGLFYGSKTDKNFEKLFSFKYSNEYILYQITKNDSPAQVIERIKDAQNIVLSDEQAKSLLENYQDLEVGSLYNSRKLPFQKLAIMQAEQLSVGWAGMDHSADFVELAAFGPGSELLKPFVLNTELHALMLTAAEVKDEK